MLLVLSIPALWLSSHGYSQVSEVLPDSVADYRAYFKALEYDGLSQFAYVISELQPVWSFTPRSPLNGQAALLAARSHAELGQPAEAVTLLRTYASELPQPAGLMQLAKALESTQDMAAAVAAYQRIYFEYPFAAEAIDAEFALERLKVEVGDAYPPAVPGAMFDRAAQLMRAGQQDKARREYEGIAALTEGRDRDLALVRARSGSEPQLAALTVTSPEANAERLFLLHSAARRAKNETRAGGAVDELSRKYPKSPWLLEGLISSGNMYLLRNDVKAFSSAYEACYRAFPSDRRSAYCHWKVAWSRYINRDPAAASMLREHADRYPNSDKRPAALYFLGRYADVILSYPQSYYAVLSRARLGANAPMVKRAAGPEFEPGPALSARLDRARILETAGYGEWAEFELKYAAADGQPFAVAIALAELAAGRGAHDQSIRYIKHYAKGYLSIPFEAAPERFWRIAFPMPYRAPLESYSRSNSLDPFVVAALIRQESEFNPRAISSARAYGLTQVLPSTGRELSRRVGLRGFAPSMLFEPDVNLKLGTMYLKSQLDQHGGSWENTLAAYNAGKSRVAQWSTWGDFREPAEFIETIPFTETREYVQIVLRNADIYRRLYGSTRTADNRAR
jgi:soluble lytic murein transglycosylase